MGNGVGGADLDAESRLAQLESELGQSPARKLGDRLSPSLSGKQPGRGGRGRRGFSGGGRRGRGGCASGEVKRFDPVTGKRACVPEDSREADEWPRKKPKAKMRFKAATDALLTPVGGEIARKVFARRRLLPRLPPGAAQAAVGGIVRALPVLAAVGAVLALAAKAQKHFVGKMQQELKAAVDRYAKGREILVAQYEAKKMKIPVAVEKALLKDLAVRQAAIQKSYERINTNRFESDL